MGDDTPTRLAALAPLLAPGADRARLLDPENVKALAGIYLAEPESWAVILAKLSRWTPHWAELKKRVDAFVKKVQVRKVQKRAEDKLEAALEDAKDAGRAIVQDGNSPIIARDFMTSQMPTLIYVDEVWLLYTGTYYRTLKRGGVRSALSKWLLAGTSAVNGEDYVTSKRDKDDIMDAITDACFKDPELYKPPSWLDSDGTEPDPKNTISLRNGLLDISTGTLMKHTKDFFTRYGLTHEFDPEATCPEWEETLKRWWPGAAGQEQIDALQEWMGYLLTSDTSIERILNIVGPTRSGKGTIIHVIRALIGKSNIVEGSLNTLGGQFGLQSAIGKSVMIFGDARLGKHSDPNAIAEALLNISGGDGVNANRKNKDFWEGMLDLKIVIASNMELSFPDTSGAINRRMFHLVMTESYLGIEDTELKHRLAREAAGVLNWALKGLARLDTRRDAAGRRVGFVDTSAGKAVARKIAQHSSPVMAFMQEVCTVAPGKLTKRGVMFQTYEGWMRSNGVKPWQKLDAFVREVHTVNRNVECVHIEGTDANTWHFTGMEIKPEYRGRKWPSEASMELTEDEEESPEGDGY